MKQVFASLAIVTAFVSVLCGSIPQLRQQSDAIQLLVKDKPFLILGGELGNSSGESAYLAPFWDKMTALNLNTLLVPVSWNLVEPVEGKYDWSTLDDMIRDARVHDTHLVLLWFGAWKNSMSCYAPDWVKVDTARFRRCLSSSGKPVEIVTPLSDEALRCDSRAFAAMMKHLRAIDGEQNTVVMVQVENEIGMVGDARDHSSLADAAFAKAVPAELISYLNDHFDILHPKVRAMWQHIRWLSGDQTHQGRHIRLDPGRFSMQRVRLYRYR